MDTNTDTNTDGNTYGNTDTYTDTSTDTNIDTKYLQISKHKIVPVYSVHCTLPSKVNTQLTLLDLINLKLTKYDRPGV